MITTAQVRASIDWVDRSGVPAHLESLLRHSRRGRPRQLSVRGLLVGIKLAIDDAKTSCLSDVHDILTRQLRRREQLELGVRTAAGHLITVHQVRRLFSSISRAVDPSPHTNPTLQEGERAQRAATLQQLLDHLLDATMADELTHHGGYALDGTGIWSWARGKRRTDTSADRDARWGSKTSKRGGQEPYFGYELHALVRINSSFQDRRHVPCLAERIVIAPAATNPVTAVLPTLTRLADDDAVREIVADRGYTYKTNWTRDLHALGIDPVLDLHTTQYGPRGSHDGARIITGVPHCPAMPDGLDTIRRPERLADSPALDQLHRPDRPTRTLGLSPRHHRRHHRQRTLRMPRPRRQSPLPTAPAVHGQTTRPAHRHHPTGPPGHLLHPAHHHRPRRRRRQEPAAPLLGIPRMDRRLHPSIPRRRLVRQPQKPQHRRPHPRRIPRHGPSQNQPHARHLRRRHQPAPTPKLDLTHHRATPRRQRPPAATEPLDKPAPAVARTWRSNAGQARRPRETARPP